ncbi:MAG: gluconolactonase [Coprococcus phoceensis]
MRLPLGRANTFEAAGKQGCDCVAWSRKRRTGFISRQGYMKAPVPRPTPDFGTKYPELVDTLTTKQTDFPLKIEMGGKPF